MGQSIAAFSFCLIPIAAGIAILRHKLYDIDVVINRSLVYGSLAAFITGVYVAIVVGIGRAIGARGGPNLGLSIAATAVVAVAFQPVRERVQHFANRLVYGKRATPYEVMSGFAARIGGALSVDEALPRMAEAAALGVGATSAAVRVRLHDGSVQAVTWPADATAPPSFDHVERVRYGDEEVGDISVAKPRGEALTPSEVRLLDDLGAQAGLAMHNVRLALELRSRVEEISRQAEEIGASRQRIVTAQDDARRALQRRIQEGPERQLASIEHGLADAESLVTSDPAQGQALLDRLAAETTSTLDALRELARGVYPPLLADKGLTAALSAQAANSSVPAAVDADGVGRFEPAIEAAVYFCCLEALQNVAAHADARHVEIVLRRRDGELTFSVEDDGKGFDSAAAGASPGLQRMADRLAALGGALSVGSSPGGGTKVAGWVPEGVGERQPAAAAADHAASSRSGPNTDFGM
jgi:signal transduction histidine kinase